ncbi:MAG: hypothetical protein CM1200mP2_19560 [Planctomycetaceae bacterium]|nr:MAG: hypothetical protein CM1200mP2_19560 [Planctomycetaceae bacterium]
MISLAVALPKPPSPLCRVTSWGALGGSGRGAAVSNFSYSGPLTETVLWVFWPQSAPGRRLEWDGAKMKIRNAPELNQYVHNPTARGGRLAHREDRSWENPSVVSLKLLMTVTALANVPSPFPANSDVLR